MTTQPQLYRLVRTATVIGPRAAIEGEPRREVGWLIEREDDHRWAIVLSDKLISWTSDSLKALRFARKEEAELFVELAQFSGPIKATEHIWMEPMRTVTDFHSVNLSTGEKTRSIVGDGQRVDEIVGPLLPKGPCSCQWEYSEIVYRDPNCPHLRRERIRKGLKLSTEEGSVQVAAIDPTPPRTAKQVVDEFRSTGSQDWDQLASAIDYWAMNDFCPRFMGERK